MISFPFDSHIEWDSTGAPIYDRAVTSEPYRKLIKELFTTGINPKDSSAFQVIPGSDMNVIVTGGFAVVEGMMNLEQEIRTLAVQASDSSYDRIDTVVLRLDDNDDVRICDLYVITGTPAETPVRPDLTREGDIYEIGLADLFISKASVSISADKITDTRYDAERCGVIAPIAEIDTTTLNKLMEEYQKENQASFKEWVASLKDILDEETAGHLQLEIEALNEKIDNIDLSANKVSYDDTDTQLGAENVQGAITQLNTHLTENDTTISAINADLSNKQDKGNYLSSDYIKISEVNLTCSSDGIVEIPQINGYRVLTAFQCSGEWVYLEIYNSHSWYCSGQLYYLKTHQLYDKAQSFEYLIYYIKI